MKRYRNKYRIASARAQWWDYGWNGAYFITICTQNRAHFFGEIVGGVMELSPMGEIAQSEWLKTFEMRPDMNLWMGEYVVMPNHFHAIIGIGDNEFNTQRDTQRRDAMHCVSNYTEGDAKGYSPDLGLFKEEIIQFLQDSQPKKWAKISSIHGASVNNRIIQRLYKELDLRGSLDVIRNGFVDYGVRFQMAFFAPASGLNPDAVALYNQNQLKVYRQIYFSAKNRKSVDVVLSLNGIPLATLELKNQFTGQNAGNALKQYSTTRDNRELLFAFKKRALVHFAVDQDEVFMATKLEGSKTYWLPFNRGNNNGKGNPQKPDGYRTAYLWENILRKDSWMDILQRFIHLQTEEFEYEGRTRKKEKLIFPRYHQLDAVRAITADVLEHGAGRNYLVQHSAGSGKSNSIAWLAYRLSSLHNDGNERIFDSVIVITDRRVLDKQLQDTIYQFEHKQGVVQKIDKDSTQLAESLQHGTNIIITTLQKFPYVVEKVGQLPDRKYAVIIDEAHSS